MCVWARVRASLRANWPSLHLTFWKCAPPFHFLLPCFNPVCTHTIPGILLLAQFCKPAGHLSVVGDVRILQLFTRALSCLFYPPRMSFLPAFSKQTPSHYSSLSPSPNNLKHRAEFLLSSLLIFSHCLMCWKNRLVFSLFVLWISSVFICKEYKFSNKTPGNESKLNSEQTVAGRDLCFVCMEFGWQKRARYKLYVSLARAEKGQSQSPLNRGGQWASPRGSLSLSEAGVPQVSLGNDGPSRGSKFALSFYQS